MLSKKIQWKSVDSDKLEQKLSYDLSAGTAVLEPQRIRVFNLSHSGHGGGAEVFLQ